jgi:hypothetical protein
MPGEAAARSAWGCGNRAASGRGRARRAELQTAASNSEVVVRRRRRRRCPGLELVSNNLVIVRIDRRLLLGSTVGSCWDRPSALARIDRRLFCRSTIKTEKRSDARPHARTEAATACAWSQVGAGAAAADHVLVLSGVLCSTGVCRQRRRP